MKGSAFFLTPPYLNSVWCCWFWVFGLVLPLLCGWMTCAPMKEKTQRKHIENDSYYEIRIPSSMLNNVSGGVWNIWMQNLSKPVYHHWILKMAFIEYNTIGYTKRPFKSLMTLTWNWASNSDFSILNTPLFNINQRTHGSFKNIQ